VINPGDVNGLDKNHPDHHLLLGANESGHRGHDGLDIAHRSPRCSTKDHQLIQRGERVSLDGEKGCEQGRCEG
jgi:hypothetical protein